MDAMADMCGAVADIYDAVFYCTDTFDPRAGGDDFRVKVADRQHEVDHVLKNTCAEAGIPLIAVPEGLSTAERVKWISVQLAKRELLPSR